MDITLHAGGEVVVDHLPYTFEIHSSCHNLCRYHDPALTATHSGNSVVALFLSHTRVQAVYVGYPVEC